MPHWSSEGDVYLANRLLKAEGSQSCALPTGWKLSSWSVKV